MSPSRLSRTSRFSASFLLAAILFFACVCLLAIRWQQGREEGIRSTCEGHLYGIGYGIRSYHQLHGTYPPLADATTASSPTSWRVLILTTSIAGDFLKSYRADEHWDSTHNRQFINHLYGRSFTCPADLARGRAGKTSYLAIGGKGALWSEVVEGRIRDPEKEAPHAIIVMEVPNSDVFWTEPRDISVDEAIAVFQATSRVSNSRHRGGLHYLAADGTVGSLDEIESVEEFARLLTVTD